MMTAMLMFAPLLLAAPEASAPAPVHLGPPSILTGRRRGYAAVLGVCLGLAVIGLAAAFGLAAVISGNPAVSQTLKWAGVAYLMWLARDG